MTTIDRVRTIVEPLLAERGLAVYDIEHAGGVVRVLVEGPEGVDLDVLAELTRALSLALDEADPVPGRYTLEVSSPGLERPLRAPHHFQRAVGDEITVKTRAEIDGQRRFRGTLVDAGDDAIVVADESDGTEHRIRHSDIDKARTVFQWGPAPKPGKGPKKNKKQKNTTTAKAASS